MSTTPTMQDDKDTAGKISIWVAGTSAADQALEGAEALFTEPRVSPPKSESEVGALAGATEHPQGLVCEEVNRLVRLTGTRAPHRLFEVLQQWEGIVSEVTEDTVWASLVDLTDRERAEEIVELSLAEISEEDRAILRPGSVFYWAIGYERSLGGQIRRVSEIRVRRTPQWSQHSINLLKAKAVDLMDRFGDNAENPTPTAK